MINILIRGEDNFYKDGMQYLLQELFYQKWHKEITLRDTFTEQGIRQADMIIIGFGPGENMTCIPEMIDQRRALMIGIVDTLPKEKRQTPGCFQNMRYILRSSPLAEISAVITNHWIARWQSLSLFDENPCLRCKPRALSQQQSRVMELLFREMSTPHIAQEMGISEKTVFAHKYQVMQRFNLRTDYELYAFLSKKMVKTIRSPSLGML